MSDTLLVQLQQGLKDMGLSAARLPLQAYLSYIDLLTQWSLAYNLTAIRDPQKMLAYHVMDSLSILPFIQKGVCLDVGTGAGLPGIILALAMPDTHWFLLDGNNKKTRFVQQAVITLNLKNVKIIYSRIEKYQTEQCFSTIVSRAFTSLAGFYACSHHLLEPGGCLLAMKGSVLENELADLIAKDVVTKVTSLSIPGVTGTRNLVQIMPKS